MSEPKLAEQTGTGSKWLIRTIGLSIVTALAIVAVLALAVSALQAPATRSVAAQSQTNNQSTEAGSSTVAQTASVAQSVALAIPTLLPTAGPESSTPSLTAASSSAAPSIEEEISQAKADEHRVLLPVVSTASDSTSSGLIAPSTRVVTSVPTVAAPRVAAPRSVPAVRPKLAATAVSLGPLHFNFNVKPYCHKTGENIMVVDVFLTGFGGQPPYTYYHDTELIAGPQREGTRLTVKAASGNPVPFKISIVDSAGQRYTEEFFYKTNLRCK